MRTVSLTRSRCKGAKRQGSTVETMGQIYYEYIVRYHYENMWVGLFCQVEGYEQEYWRQLFSNIIISCIHSHDLSPFCGLATPWLSVGNYTMVKKFIRFLTHKVL